MARKKTKPFTCKNYFAALALENLASQAHETSNMLDDHVRGKSVELSEAFYWASRRLRKQAHSLFPLYPHPNWPKGREWAQAQGLV